MSFERQLSRIAKLLVETEHIDFDEAQNRLRGFTLEIVVGPDANSPTAHAAVLTAVLVGSRTFVGGVRIAGATDQPLNSSLPLNANTIADAAVLVGAASFAGEPSHRIVVGRPAEEVTASATAVWWRGWQAGAAAPNQFVTDEGINPLVGIAAGAVAVGRAFDASRGVSFDACSTIDLWPCAEGEQAPPFEEIYLPGALWLVGLGNLGQAFLWALSALPYADPSKVTLVLQDRDKVSEENWATSVLVQKEVYGELKTRVGESWAQAKGFELRRVDRRLQVSDRLEADDPRVALSGVDKIEVRRHMSQVGFECIVDVGLGRSAAHFSRYRVTVCDRSHPIDKHFQAQKDESSQPFAPKNEAYQQLETEIGRCGAAEIAGASVAAPYVSALAAAVAISRLIALVSDCPVPRNEVGKISSLGSRKLGPASKIDARGVGNAGKPQLLTR